MRFAFAELAGGPGAEPREIATATLSGNLTRDVELRELPSGAEVGRLRVATATRRCNGEEWVDKTN
jgi:single-stranded DNA-binding protein